MEASKISQLVAQKLFYKNSKIPDELQKANDSRVIKDKVTLSNDAVAYTNTKSGSTDFEKNQELHFQSVKNQVQTDNYSIDNEVISQIADTIVNSLL